MNRRFLKQLVYGTFFASLVLIPLVFFIISSIKPPSCVDNKRNQREEGVDCGGPCIPCLAKNLAPIQVIWENYFAASPTQIAVGAKIRNPNLEAGARVKYRFHVEGGNELASVGGETVIHPGVTKHVIDGALDVDFRQIYRVTFELEDVEWRPAQVMPEREIFEIKSVVGAVAEDGSAIEISGLVVNTSRRPQEHIRVFAVVGDAFGLPLLASKTLLNDVAINEARSFRMLIPKGVVPVEKLDFTRMTVEAEAVY